MAFSENTAQKILTSAYELLSTKGLAQVSMRDIAKRAGVALSQITYYFKTKENLIASVVANQFHRLMDKVAPLLEGCHSQEEAEQVAAEYFYQDQNMLRLLIDFTAQALWVPAFREQVEKWQQKATEILTRIPRFSEKAEQTARKVLAGFFGNAVLAVFPPESTPG